ELNKLNIDGLFFYDIGIVNLKKKLCLNYDLVWAQEHFTTNYNTCNYWYNLNVKYGFISSEITKENILEIKKNTSMKLIVTLFGHVPMFTSKRHLVDNYLKHFNLTNKGTYIRKENKQYPIVDNKEGTTVYSNYVLNAIDEYLELSNNNIDYVFLNNFNIKQTQFRKIVQKHFKLTPNNLNKTKTYFEKLNLNLSKGFLYTETIYKVKNNE
ncbi:MAG: U32 family peptidase, partial [Bacilli bacterium]